MHKKQSAETKFGGGQHHIGVTSGGPIGNMDIQINPQSRNVPKEHQHSIAHFQTMGPESKGAFRDTFKLDSHGPITPRDPINDPSF